MRCCSFIVARGVSLSRMRQSLSSMTDPCFDVKGVEGLRLSLGLSTKMGKNGVLN